MGTRHAAADGPAPPPRPRANPIAVSTYSYWRYRDDSKLAILDCVDLADAAGFDGVEILHVQMGDESNAALQAIKRRCLRYGLDLCGFSTHQSFVNPDPRRAAKQRRPHNSLPRTRPRDGHPHDAGQHRPLGDVRGRSMN